MTGARFRAVLFDMDGTLVHTAPDIAAALNAALCKNGMRALAPAKIADLVGRGARVLIKRALGTQGLNDERLLAAVFDDYVREYATRIGSEGSAFAGAVECLRGLRARGVKTGVVTNALQRFADATLAHYGLAKYLDVVIGGDRTAMPKPHPALLWFACRTLRVEPRETLMVGDSVNDVAAARAAGCGVICVPHGYNEGRPVAELDCPIIETLAAVPDYVDQDTAPRQLPSSAA
ncbi:MAG: phosphoglycolate phosphatase [Rudaea sp.]|nr:phosphoglycolate phosphatase [Rudaea sp.]